MNLGICVGKMTVENLLVICIEFVGKMHASPYYKNY